MMFAYLKWLNSRVGRLETLSIQQQNISQKMSQQKEMASFHLSFMLILVACSGDFYFAMLRIQQAIAFELKHCFDARLCFFSCVVFNIVCQSVDFFSRHCRRLASRENKNAKLLIASHKVRLRCFNVSSNRTIYRRINATNPWNKIENTIAAEGIKWFQAHFQS